MLKVFNNVLFIIELQKTASNISLVLQEVFAPLISSQQLLKCYKHKITKSVFGRKKVWLYYNCQNNEIDYSRLQQTNLNWVRFTGDDKPILHGGIVIGFHCTIFVNKEWEAVWLLNEECNKSIIFFLITFKLISFITYFCNIIKQSNVM